MGTFSEPFEFLAQLALDLSELSDEQLQQVWEALPPHWRDDLVHVLQTVHGDIEAIGGWRNVYSCYGIGRNVRDYPEIHLERLAGGLKRGCQRFLMWIKTFRSAVWP